ncbi:hypothetical protein ABVT39_018473 [Epinephelus coioides]
MDHTAEPGVVGQAAQAEVAHTEAVVVHVVLAEVAHTGAVAVQVALAEVAHTEAYVVPVVRLVGPMVGNHE